MPFKTIILRKANDNVILFKCKASALNYPVPCSNQSLKTYYLPHSHVFHKLEVKNVFSLYIV